jgi:hypothetical protein
MFSAFRRICLVASLSLSGALVCSAQKPNFVRPRPTYVSFQVANSTGTFPTCINNLLTVAGYYNIGDSGQSEAFVRDISGKIQTFEVGSLMTQAVAINDLGEIAGIYQDVSGQQGGFVRSRKGVIMTFSPGGEAGGTSPTGIDDNGMVTGFYTTGNSPPTFGFVRYRDGGIVTFNATRDTDVTIPWGINNQGASTGAYSYDGDTQVGGFVRSPDGCVTTFQYQQGIVPMSINDSGTTTGWYGPTAGPPQGFVRSADGKITPFALPGQIGTTSIHIIQAGVGVGTYTTEMGSASPSLPPVEFTYGFIRSSGGQIVSFEVSGPSVFITTPTGINDLGVVTGSYFPQSGELSGFLRIP